MEEKVESSIYDGLWYPSPVDLQCKAIHCKNWRILDQNYCEDHYLEIQDAEMKRKRTSREISSDSSERKRNLEVEDEGTVRKYSLRERRVKSMSRYDSDSSIRVSIETKQSGIRRIGLNGKEEEGFTCHQCMKNKDNEQIVQCQRCKSKRYCVPCLERWYSHISVDEIKKQCPFCSGNCNCKACLRSHSNFQKLKDTEMKMNREKVVYSKYIVHTLLPSLKQINQEQMGEKVFDAKIQDDTRFCSHCSDEYSHSEVANGTTTGTIVYKDYIISMADGFASNSQNELITGRELKLREVLEKYILTRAGDGEHHVTLERKITNGLCNKKKMAEDVMKEAQNFVDRWETKEGRHYPAAISWYGFQNGKLKSCLVSGGNRGVYSHILNQSQSFKVVFTGSGTAHAVDYCQKVMKNEMIESEQDALSVLERCMVVAGLRDEHTGGFYSYGEVSRNEKPKISEVRGHLLQIACNYLKELEEYFNDSLLMLTTGRPYLRNKEPELMDMVSASFDGVKSLKLLGIQRNRDMSAIRL